MYIQNKGCEPFDKSVQELYHHNLINWQYILRRIYSSWSYLSGIIKHRSEH